MKPDDWLYGRVMLQLQGIRGTATGMHVEMKLHSFALACIFSGLALTALLFLSACLLPSSVFFLAFRFELVQMRINCSNEAVSD